MCHAVLIHTCLRQIEQCFAAAAKVMHKDSVFLATFKFGEADDPRDEWVWPGTTEFTRETIRGIAEANRMGMAEIDWPYPYQHQWVELRLV